MTREYRILGPLEALVDGRPVDLGPPRQRAFLAVLLSRAGELVPVTRLVDDLWRDDPPESALNILQSYVSRLRKVLGRDAIATRGAAYAVAVTPGTLDLHRFEALARDGARALEAGRAEDAAGALAEALALWRGPPLADLATDDAAARVSARLEELRLVALEHRLEAEIAVGRADAAAAALEALCREHPLRERMRGLLMLARYLQGRQADALAVFRDARRVLVEELGIEPGPALQELEAAILRQDETLGRAPWPGSLAAEAPPTRSILVAAVDLGRLDVLLPIGELLARRPVRELVVTAVASREALGTVAARLNRCREELLSRGVRARTAGFTSSSPAADLVRLSIEQEVDLVLADATAALLDDGIVATLVRDAPCDVALVAGGTWGTPGPVLVPFVGADHDWAAVELGAWVARAQGIPLVLAGTAELDRDASRLLASASLAVQRTVGVATEPLLIDPEPAALLRVAETAGLVVAGLSDGWQSSGLGVTRTALATGARPPVLLVRRGLRPGGLAPRESHTRFTWTIGPVAG